MPNRTTPKIAKARRVARSELSYRLLAIDPGTRRVGTAVFEGSSLIYERAKDYGSQPDTKKLLKLISKDLERTIRVYRPSLIALERTFFYMKTRSSKPAAIDRMIKRIAKKHGVEVVEIAARTVRRILLGTGSATKFQLAEEVCRYYPHLSIYLKQTWNYAQTHWSNLFDAVAVGLACLVRDERTARLRRPRS